MKRILALAVTCCGLSFGQASDMCTPSVYNVPSAKYPCVYPDHRAMFRVIAPNAQRYPYGSGRGSTWRKARTVSGP